MDEQTKEALQRLTEEFIIGSAVIGITLGFVWFLLDQWGPS